MNSTVAAPRWEAPWQADTLLRALTALRRTDPRVPDAVFDDLNQVLEEHAPPADLVDVLTKRLKGALGHLVSVAIDADPAAAAHPLVARAQELTTAQGVEAPESLGRLRHLAWATHDLLEALVEANHVRLID
ncbi:DUF6415 family natural product biosynthesis protein [Streptomyces sp. V1I6]|uniref:DUF6415 family natural product biosynthesis protein n=1 Tax=Streptomyces sp. V1I6 TaxID=3042273 RepID=UPI0027814513|nr:DUF6415 family natural product biosynthesis protein [Streptomyces sp. V1I6]MDQ0840337.1 hypothetical protein [Streptomyces sp. V1I6]